MTGPPPPAAGVARRPFWRPLRALSGASLRVWLWLLVAVSLLPLMGWTALQTLREERALLAKADAAVAATAVQRATGVSAFVEEVDAALATMSVLLPAVAGDPRAAVQALERIDAMTGDRIRDLYLHAPDGRLIAASREPRTALVDGEGFVAAALLSRGLSAAAVLAEPGTGQRFVLFARPVLNPRGSPIAVASVATRLETLGALLGANGGETGSVATFVFDRSGSLVFDDGAGAAHGPAAAEACRERALGMAPARATAPGPLGLAEIPGVGWRVCVVADSGAAVASVRSAMRTQWLVVLGTLLAAALLATALGQRIVMPAIGLQRSAHRLVAGDPDHRAAVAGPAELRALARDFNAMADALAAERERLRAAERRWQFALDGAGDGVWDWHVPSGTVFYSARWKSMLGYGEAEIGDDVMEWDSRIHPEDRVAVYEDVNRHFDGVTAVYVNEHRVRRADGSWCWILDRGKVVERDAAGRPVRMIGTHTDLTQRRAAEEALREAEQRWQFALESAGEGVWDWDIQRGHTYRSPRHLAALGYAPGELAGTQEAWIELIHPEDRAATAAALHAHLRGDTPDYAREYRIRHRDGRWLWHSVRGRVVERATDGRPLRLIGAVRDVTAQKEGALERERLLAEREALERRLALALDRAPVGAMMLDAAFRITYWNAECERIFGFTAMEAAGRTPYDLFVPPEALASVRRLEARLRGGEQDAHGVSRTRARDGRTLVTEWRNLPLRGSDGDFAGVLSMVQDVTERVAGEAERARLLAEKQELAERLQAQVENTPIACFLSDWEYGILDANPAAERLFGWPREELLGRDLLDVLVPEPQRGAIRVIRARLAAGERSPRAVNNNLTRDGRLLTCEWHTALMPDRKTVLSMGIDVTERERAELALRESEARYRGLIEVAPDGVAVMRQGRVVYANEAMARIARAAQPSDLKGAVFTDLLVPEERPGFAERLERLAVETGTGPGGEQQMLARDGTVIDVDVRLASYSWDGEVHVQVIVRDNTTRKLIHRRVLQINSELERRVQARTAELEAANLELEAFSYSVAHDLRAPLRAIDGYARLLGEDLAGAAVPAPVPRSLERIRVNVARMADLIDDLLAYARIGRHELTFGDVDTAALVADVAAGLKESFPGTRISIGPLPRVRGDATLLRQVFSNLVGNALKFSAHAAAPAVEIACRTAGDEHEFRVSDNGVGFSMTYAAKLFGMFQRLHSAEEFEGTGVGLAIVQRALQRHGGRAWAESEEGHGATFRFVLPA